ncbi:hypothetical protein KC19_VG264500 [Ceratodon purpureus]|uniref:Autophagy-related protein 27 n=1 Tax=Ceratodon purpureus TaxID=3225 RepID=A0A8T0HUJ3_CERPU|nr:hypothetical protein KC19_VG264500 [Ceratodon purpureus]
MGWLVAFFVALQAVVGFGTAQMCAAFVNSDSCEWSAVRNGKKFSFNLATSIKAYPHGILSEDGYYKISTNEGRTHYWFQLCEHMKFNFNRPRCENCEACGGSEHCGETCSALMSSSYPGYSICNTLGYPGSSQYSFINQNKPEQGVRVNLALCNKTREPNCSFSVLVYCSHTGVEVPIAVTNKTVGSCDYETTLRHPAGCPVVTVTSEGGWGWFGSLLFMLVLAFVVYMTVGIAYRVTILGVSGLEALPNLDVWRSLLSKLQVFVYGHVHRFQFYVT